eukprot:403363875
MENILYYKEYSHDSHPLYLNAGDHGRYKKIETCAKNKLVIVLTFNNCLLLFRPTEYAKDKIKFQFINVVKFKMNHYIHQVVATSLGKLIMTSYQTEHAKYLTSDIMIHTYANKISEISIQYEQLEIKAKSYKNQKMKLATATEVVIAEFKSKFGEKYDQKQLQYMNDTEIVVELCNEYSLYDITPTAIIYDSQKQETELTPLTNLQSSASQQKFHDEQTLQFLQIQSLDQEQIQFYNEALADVDNKVEIVRDALGQNVLLYNNKDDSILMTINGNNNKINGIPLFKLYQNDVKFINGLFFDNVNNQIVTAIKDNEGIHLAFVKLDQSISFKIPN